MTFCVPVPEWLASALEAGKKAVDRAGDKLTGGDDFYQPNAFLQPQCFRTFYIFHLAVMQPQLPFLSLHTIFEGPASHLLMQFADAGLNVDVTDHIKIRVAKNFGPGIVVDPQTMPPRGQRIMAAVWIHPALRCTDTQTFPRWIIVAFTEVVAVDICPI